MSRFTWIPFFEELADKLLDYRDRQRELISLTERLRAQGLPAVSTNDRFADGSAGTMTEMDPFTFYSNFNRGITEPNRQKILAEIKKELGIAATVPTDFDGIPLANNQSSWFVGYSKDRSPTDVPTLWQLAEAAIASERVEDLPPDLFSSALDIDKVAIAKLTMGLFWLRPNRYLPLDRKTRDYLGSRGIPTNAVADLESYLAVVAAAREKLGEDFASISLDAYEHQPEETTRYWVGGFGRHERLEKMLAGSYWDHNWDERSSRTPAKKVWELFDQIRVGDELAIKGYGGRNDLKTYLVGRVTSVEPERCRVNLERLDRPLFHGKAPKGATPGWFHTLAEVRDPEAVGAVFRGVKIRDKVPSADPVDLPRNLVLFGPPGTGKTYQLLRWKKAFFGHRDDSVAPDVGENLDDVADLPLWQLVGLVLAGSEPLSVRELKKHPLLLSRAASSTGKRFGPQIWNVLQTHTKQDCPNVGVSKRSEPLIFWKDESSRWSVDSALFFEAVPELEALVSVDPKELEREERFVFVTFHQSFSYEDFVEGIRPEVGETEEITYRVVPGIFRKIVNRALADEDGRPHAIFIDELNRANIAKVLGELITLLEEDKRLGGESETTVQLPYSGDRFGVPQNLWVIATMNTADRSIAQLDAALRRRFEFRELLPDADVVRDLVGDNGVIEEVDVARLMETLNERIEFLYDRDHRLGHSYFLRVESLDDLRRVFLENVVPLLQDYFYDDWEKVCLVLGCAATDFSPTINPRPIVERTVQTAEQVFGEGAHQVEDRRVRYSVSQTFERAEGATLEEFFLAVYGERLES